MINGFLKSSFWWLIPACLSCIVFVNSIKGDFFWDDRMLILNNPLVKNWSSSLKMFAPEYWKEKHVAKGQYRPLRNLTFTWDYSFWHNNPIGYHITNISMHVVTTALVSLLVYMISRSSLIALIAGGFFAVHPAHIESINYIKNRSDLLCTLFFIGSFMTWLSYKFVWSIPLYVLSIMGKELGIVLPAVLVVYIMCFTNQKDWFKRFKATLPYWGICSFFLFWKFVVLKPAVKEHITSHITGVEPVRLIMSTFKAYLGLLFFQFDFNVDRVLPVLSSVFSVEALLFYLILAVSTIMVVKMKITHKPLILFGCAWILITLSPISNIIPLTGRPFAEQRLYLPSVGWAICISGIAAVVLEYQKLKWYVITAMTTVIFFWSGMIVKRNLVWQDEELLWETARIHNPTNSRAWLSLAGTKLRKGKYDEVLALYEHIMPSLPEGDLDDVYTNMGIIYQTKGNIKTALEYFLKAKEIKQDNYEIWSNIGSMYLLSKDLPHAEEALKKAIELEDGPLSAGALTNLGIVYLSQKRLTDAARSFRKAVTLNADLLEARINLANIYQELGMDTMAQQEIEEIKLRMKTGSQFGVYNPEVVVETN